MSTLAEEIGSCRVWVKGDKASFVLHPECFPGLKAAWMGGKAFHEGWDCYGDPIVVKLGEVVAVALWTPGGIAQAIADRKTAQLTGDE